MPEGEDYRHLVTYQDRVVFANRFWMFMLAVPLLLLGLTAYEFWHYGGLFATLRIDPAALLIPAVAVLWLAAHWRNAERKARKFAMSQPVGIQTFRVEADGLAVDDGSRRFKYAWRDLVDVVETNGMMLFVHTREGRIFKATMVPLKSARGEPAMFREAALANFRASRSL